MDFTPSIIESRSGRHGDCKGRVPAIETCVAPPDAFSVRAAHHGETFGAFVTPPQQRGRAQDARVALSDRLIAELEAADGIVLQLPMYNLQVPSSLKACVDHVAQAVHVLHAAARLAA